MYKFLRKATYFYAPIFLYLFVKIGYLNEYDNSYLFCYESIQEIVIFINFIVAFVLGCCTLGYVFLNAFRLEEMNEGEKKLFYKTIWGEAKYFIYLTYGLPIIGLIEMIHRFNC